jgi:hypothetical protein
MDIAMLKDVYKSKRERLDKKTGKVIHGFKNTTFDDFLKWFEQSKFNDGCFYCGISNGQSFRLYETRKSKTRGGKRGRRLELDRVDSELSYDTLNNIVWCCYWCNNAKSNFFSGQEFKTIAIEIGKALNKILEQSE